MSDTGKVNGAMDPFGDPLDYDRRRSMNDGTLYGACGVRGCIDCRPLFDVLNRELGTCRHCGRTIAYKGGGVWIDPEATGDDSMWRETCDSHDTFTAEHEPTEAEGGRA